MTKTYNILVNGYGGEISVGKVEKATYDFFVQNGIDIDDYYLDDDNELNIPEEHQFVPPGAFYECDNLARAFGCEIDEESRIEVYDENGELVWSHNLEINELQDHGITTTEEFLFDRHEQSKGTCIYIGQSVEKGCFFNSTLTLNEPFDPIKLRFEIETIDDWSLLSSIKYENTKLENDGPDTSGKSFQQEFFMIGE
jgi:hypothetical protein